MNGNRKVTKTKSRPRVYSKTKDPNLSYMKTIFNSQKCDANPNHRNIPWNLSFEEWCELVIQDCYICGSEPQLREGKLHMSIGTRVPINGIDRLVSEKGYVKGNVAPCCPTCNYMKHRMTLSEMITHIDKIKEHQIAHL